MTPVRIGIIGDFDGSFPPHALTNTAIEHGGAHLGCTVDAAWLATDEEHDYSSFQALWCAPGSPYRSLDGALRAIRIAREQDIPFLGTCGGFQHAVLEYGRNVMRLNEAAHAEYDADASVLFVTQLGCSLVGKTMPVRLKPASRAAAIYGTTDIEETYYCTFGLNPAYRESLEAAGLIVSGFDADGEARIVELPGHRFYFGTLFLPQGRSTAESPHPLIVEFVKAACRISP